VALFRRLAVVTAVFAYLQIALGGVVRVSGSGLGCPDWPLCQGRPYPPADAHAMLLAFNYADSKDLAIFENFYNAITFPYPQCQAPVSPAPSPS